MGFAQPIYENDLEVTDCCTCGVAFALPLSLHRTAKEKGSSFYCPNGHSLVYKKTDVQKLQEELQQANERVATANKLRWEQEERAVKAERKLKRVHRGVCPECKRTFRDVARHMQTKHPNK